MLDLVALASGSASLEIDDRPVEQARSCACCGAAIVEAHVAGIGLCPTCLPAFALDMPGIDEVAQLIWLPQMEQGVLSRLVRALHCACTAQNRSALDGAEPVLAAQRAFQALRALQAGAVDRIGTDRPSELRACARHLSATTIATRNETGLRILMLGTWFRSSPTFYAERSRQWIGQA